MTARSAVARRRAPTCRPCLATSRPHPRSNHAVRTSPVPGLGEGTRRGASRSRGRQPGHSGKRSTATDHDPGVMTVALPGTALGARLVAVGHDPPPRGDPGAPFRRWATGDRDKTSVTVIDTITTTGECRTPFEAHSGLWSCGRHPGGGRGAGRRGSSPPVAAARARTGAPDRPPCDEVARPPTGRRVLRRAWVASAPCLTARCVGSAAGRSGSSSRDTGEPSTSPPHRSPPSTPPSTSACSDRICPWVHGPIRASPHSLEQPNSCPTGPHTARGWWDCCCDRAVRGKSSTKQHENSGRGCAPDAPGDGGARFAKVPVRRVRTGSGT